MMDALLKEVLNWTLIFCLVTFGLVIILNWFQHGFFWQYIRVKSSRGKKLLVQVNTIMDKYYRIGYITEGFLLYKKRHNKEKCRLCVPPGAVYKNLGIYFIDVDEEKNCIRVADYSVVEGFDAEKIEGYMIRLLKKPSLQDNKQLLIIVFLLVIMLLAFVIIGLIIDMKKKLGLQIASISTIP
jgi:hypothetical protein